MKKKLWAVLTAGTAAGAWYIHRDRKYPVRRSLRFANKLAVPGCVLGAGTAKLANRALTRMGMKLPAPPQGIERRGTQIPSEDGTAVRLTIYRPEALDWAAPVLPAPGLPCDRLPDGNGLHAKIHGQPAVECGTEPKYVKTVSPGRGPRDAGVRRTHAGP